jgi:hypothetical protein
VADGDAQRQADQDLDVEMLEDAGVFHGFVSDLFTMAAAARRSVASFSAR